MRQQLKPTGNYPADAPGEEISALSKSVFDALPDCAFQRESQLVQSAMRPKSTAPLPFSAPTLWRMVKAGNFPSPVKLSERVTAWRVGDIRRWLADPVGYGQGTTSKASAAGSKTAKKEAAK